MKKSVILCGIAVATAATICVADGCGYEVRENSVVTHTVQFIDGGKIVHKEEVEHNMRVSEYAPEPKEGYTFDCWIKDGVEYNFKRIVVEDLTLYAEWAPEEHEMKFYVDGVVIEAIKYSTGMDVTPPDVPEKEGYVGRWSYFKENGEKCARAEYTPKVYPVYFTSCGVLLAESSVKFGEEIPYEIYPEIEPREGYTAVWGDPVFNGENYTVELAYVADAHTARFLVEGKVVGERTFNSETSELTPPPVPEKEGYVGRWEDFVLGDEDIEVNAVYEPAVYDVFFTDGGDVLQEGKVAYGEQIELPETPKIVGYMTEWGEAEFREGAYYVPLEKSTIEYTASFYASGELVGEVKFTVEDDSITPPEVPGKDGYTGAWEEFELKADDITVNAVYTPKTYKVYFMNGEDVYDEGEVVFGEEIELPEKPKISGYMTEWGEAEFREGAYYVPLEKSAIEYTASFYADGELVGEVHFTVEDDSITPPPVPEKKGFKGSWGEYELGAGNIRVDAVYEPEPEPDKEVEKPPVEPQPEPDNGSESEPVEPQTEVKPVEGSEGLEYAPTDGGLAVVGYSGSDTEVVIPAIYAGQSVISVGAKAFKGNTGLTKITLAAGIKNIEARAFTGCTNLETIEIGEGLENIGDAAFSYCGRLKEIRLPKSVQKVADNAFSGCTITVYAPEGLPLSLSGSVEVKYYS